MIARLKELKLERGRIGVIGLKGLIRAPEGVVPWLMFERLREAFPNAEFVSATEIVLETRAVKSAEEIGFIREAERPGRASRSRACWRSRAKASRRM